MERRKKDRRESGHPDDPSDTEVDATAGSTTADDESPRSRRKRLAHAQEDDPAREPQPGDVLEGRYSYRLSRRLGVGGFGSVFLAECLQSSPTRRDERADTPPPEEA